MMVQYLQLMKNNCLCGKVSGYLKALVYALSEIIFTRSLVAGPVIVLLVFIRPNVALAGLVSAMSLFLFTVLVGIRKGTLDNGFYIYNPLLVGMSIGFLYKMDSKLMLFVIAATILTFLLTVKLSAVFSKYSLPVLSLPFALVSTAVYLVATKYSAIFTSVSQKSEILAGIEDHFPAVVSAFLKALGTVVFMPDICAGLVIFALLIYHSRILAVLAFTSFVTGIYFHSIPLGSIELALNNAYSFNYILVGLALGGTFLIPSLRTYLIMCIAVGISVLMVDAMTSFAAMYGIPVFTLPFNLTALLFLYTLKLHAHKNVTQDIRHTPEESLSVQLASKNRFRGGEFSIALPFAGKGHVYQGVDGEWTHKNRFRYAYDFIETDDDGCMYQNQGSRLGDYYVWGKEILSPISGYVVAQNDLLPDLPLGKVDHVNNWGNYIIIRSTEGFFVEISHLMQGSLKLLKGTYVEVGTPVARCGNSGFSPVPHIHIQVQKTGFLGDETLPFNFGCAMVNSQIKHYLQPQQGDVVEALVGDVELHRRLNLNLGTVMLFERLEKGEKVGESQFTVKRTEDLSCQFYLEDESGSKLFYAIRHHNFYFYDFRGKESSALRQLFIALPRIPLSIADKFEWSDSLPLNIFHESWQKNICLFVASFVPGFKQPSGRWIFNRSQNRITSTVTGYGHSKQAEITLHEDFGFEKIEVGDTTILRKD